MTRLKKIQAYLKVLSAHLNINFVRNEQSGERPGYPFMSYKILSSEGEPAQCVIAEYEPVAGDDSKILKTSTRESDLVISLSFIGGEKDYSNLWAFAEEAHDWMDSLSGSEAADETGLGISVKSPVQDRTVFFETAYEHRIGFDFNVKDKSVKTETMDTVDLSATIDEITYKVEG